MGRSSTQSTKWILGTGVTINTPGNQLLENCQLYSLLKKSRIVQKHQDLHTLALGSFVNLRQGFDWSTKFFRTWEGRMLRTETWPTSPKHPVAPAYSLHSLETYCTCAGDTSRIHTFTWNSRTFAWNSCAFTCNSSTFTWNSQRFHM